MRKYYSIYTIFTIITIMILAVSPAAHAATAEKLLDLLKQKGVLTAEEAETLKKEAETEGTSETGFLAVKEKMKFSGDLRLRYDTQRRDEGPGKDDIDRQRWRYRLRFGVKAEPTNTTELGFRLASGSG